MDIRRARTPRVLVAIVETIDRRIRTAVVVGRDRLIDAAIDVLAKETTTALEP
jgi:hypothetical protein